MEYPRTPAKEPSTQRETDTPNNNASRLTFDTLQRLETEVSMKEQKIEDLTRLLTETEAALKLATHQLESERNTVQHLRSELNKKEKLTDCLSKELICKKDHCDQLAEENRGILVESQRLQQLQKDLTSEVRHKSQVAVQLTHQVESPSTQYMDLCFNLGFPPPSEILQSLHTDSAIRCGGHLVTFKELSALCEVLGLGSVVNTKHWVEFHTLDLRLDGDECYVLLEELIRCMPTLKTLILHEITDNGIKSVMSALRATSWVHTIEFSKCKLTDTGLNLLFTTIQHRNALVKAQQGTASKTGKTSMSLSISSLDLSRCKVAKEATLRMIALETLTVLSLVGTGGILTDAIAQSIMQSCPNLHELDVSDAIKLTNGFISDVNTFGPRLRNLNLTGCKGITRISLKNVTTLISAFDRVTHLESESLENLPTALESLCFVTLHTPKLLALTLKNLSLTPREWDLLEIPTQNVKTLNFMSCKLTKVGDLLRRCRTIESLSLSMSRGLVDADVVMWCPRIRNLDLTNSYYISDNAIQALVQCCQRLEKVSLQRCSNITDVGLRHIAQPTSHLIELNVLECPKITVLGIDFLVSNVSSMRCVIHETYQNRNINVLSENNLSASTLDSASSLSPPKRPASLSASTFSPLSTKLSMSSPIRTPISF